MTWVMNLVQSYSSFVDLLQKRAAEQPDQHAYTFLADGKNDTRTVAYAELEQQVRAVAALLQDLGMRSERVLILHPPGLNYIVAFLGCLYAGAVAVPTTIKSNRHIQRLEALIADSQARAVLTTSQIYHDLQPRLTNQSSVTTVLDNIKWVATDHLSAELASHWHDDVIDSNTLAFLQYTSGSTSVPKGVMVSHANLLHNSALLYRYFGHSATSVLVSWLPPYHDLGLILGILQPLYGGFPAILMSPFAFVQSPLRWLQAISHYRATTSGGPNFAYDLCIDKITPEQRAELDLSSWQIALNGAEPIRAETLENFAQVFAECGFNKKAFYCCYGLAEGTLIASGATRWTTPIVRPFVPGELKRRRAIVAPERATEKQLMVSSGRVMGDQKLAIVDPATGQALPEGPIGEIWLKGPSVTQGYWRKPLETQEIFQARLSNNNEGPFLRTGDLGFIYEGDLYIAGRIKDIIIVDGQNYYPQDIELTAEHAHTAVRVGGSAAFSVDIDGQEHVVVAVEIRRTYRPTMAIDQAKEEIAKAIRRAVTDEHDLRVHTVVLVTAASLPKTSSGKIQRHLCREHFLNGMLNLWEPSYV